MTTEAEDELISVREAARECGRNMETIRRWIWGGKLPAQKLGNQLFIKRNDFTSFCRETTAKQYHAEKKEDFLKKAKALRNKIHARTGEVFDAGAMIRELREERMSEIEQSLRQKATPEDASEIEPDLLEHVREVRNKILARTGTLFDAPRDLRRLRKDRMDELLHLR